MLSFNIQPLSDEMVPALQHKINTKTKPLGALGVLEKVALQIGVIQHTLSPALKQPALIVFAGDHGITAEGVSPYPQEVTYQMVLNFLNGGAAINVFCRQNGIKIKVVDAGVNFDFAPHPDLIRAKIAHGTKNYLVAPAMTARQRDMALSKGAEIVQGMHEEGCNIIGFGEMGIGNTSSAAILMSLLGDVPLERCVGRGTGLDEAGLVRKRQILGRAIAAHPLDKRDEDYPATVLAAFGGFEIVMICGAILKAAEQKMVVLVDGFIASAAVLAAAALNRHVLAYCLFTHLSDEQGHKKLLDLLEAEPVVNLSMRLGEGSGVAVTFPLIQAAVNFLNEMASFESAQVSQSS